VITRVDVNEIYSLTRALYDGMRPRDLFPFPKFFLWYNGTKNCIYITQHKQSGKFKHKCLPQETKDSKFTYNNSEIDKNFKITTNGDTVEELCITKYLTE
jgi:hypothetical protein